MKRKLMTSVCMLVCNDVISDPRVTREAKSLSQAGYKVTVFGIRLGKLKYIKFKDGYKIVQLPKVKPLKRSRWIKTFLNKFKNHLAGSLQKRFPLLKKYLGVIAIYIYNKTMPKIFSVLRKIHRQYWLFLIFLHKYEYFRTFRQLSFIFLNYLPRRTLIFTGTKKTRGFDIYHANDLDTLPAAFILAKLNRGKLIYDAHEIWPHQQPKRSKICIKLLEKTEQFFMRQVDCAFTVNQYIADHFFKTYQLKQKPQVVLNCPKYRPLTSKRLNHERQLLIKKFNFPEKSLIVLYQGKFAIQRGVEQLILAAKHIPQNMVVVIRGPVNDYYPKLVSYAKKHRVLNQKVFFDDPAKLPDLIIKAGACDIGMLNFIPLSLNNRYILPNKLFEYMSAGLAVVASDLPALREVVDETGCGLLLKKPDWRSISKSLTHYYVRKNELKIHKLNALAAARNRFNWQNEQKKLTEIYENLTLSQ